MTTNITKTSADGRTSAKAKAGAEPLLKLNRENFPNCLRAYDEECLAEGTLGLAWFLKEAMTALLGRDDSIGMPNHNGAEYCAQGAELAFQLLIDRLDMACGRSPMPFIRDIWRDGNE